mgnify:CR=1 FL=1
MSTALRTATLLLLVCILLANLVGSPQGAAVGFKLSSLGELGQLQGFDGCVASSFFMAKTFVIRR